MGLSFVSLGLGFYISRYLWIGLLEILRVSIDRLKVGPLMPMQYAVRRNRTWKRLAKEHDDAPEIQLSKSNQALKSLQAEKTTLLASRISAQKADVQQRKALETKLTLSLQFNQLVICIFQLLKTSL